MAVEACERITSAVLISLLLLAVLGSLTGQDPKVAWTTLRVRLTPRPVDGSSPQELQDERAGAAAERFGAALAAWLPGHSAALAVIDDVAAGRKQPDAVAAVRVLIAWVCPNGLGNRLPGLATALAVAMLTDRALVVADINEVFFLAFAPQLDCEGTAARLGVLNDFPGRRQVRVCHATFFSASRLVGGQMCVGSLLKRKVAYCLMALWWAVVC
jgi:hypothetical protein